jgi:hypothetical protein
MPCVSYLANGFCREANGKDKRYGMSELRFFNPLPTPATVTMTVYYADREPAELPALTITGHQDPLLVFPHASYGASDYRKHFSDCGPWGMKFVSETPVLADHIFCAGVQGPSGNVKYAGGVCDMLIQPRLSCLWYFADLIRIIHKDIAQTAAGPFPYHEFEWYHILNPNEKPAAVKLIFYRWDGKEEGRDFAVAGRRVLMFDNYDWYKQTIGGGARFVSDIPVLVESERMIYGLKGLDEWGAHIHCPRPGTPAPLQWNEEGAKA